MGIVGGLITGGVLSLPLFDKPKKIFDDSEFWEVPTEGLPVGNGGATNGKEHEMKHM